MLRFGLLYLNGGMWMDEQLVPEEWVEASTDSQYGGYGFQWWLRSFGGYDAYFAQGHFGQFIFVVPALNMIVVYTSHNTGSTSVYWDYMSSIVAAVN